MKPCVMLYLCALGAVVGGPPQERGRCHSTPRTHPRHTLPSPNPSPAVVASTMSCCGSAFLVLAASNLQTCGSRAAIPGLMLQR